MSEPARTESEHIVVERTVVKLNGERRETGPDKMLKEGRTTLFLGGAVLKSVVCTPGEERYWAVGWLKCGRMLQSRDDIESLALSPGCVVVQLGGECGAPEGHERKAAPEWRIAARALRAGAEWLAEAPIFRATGGTHVAALLARDGERLFRTEDIGRHNAVDKAVGWAVLHDVPLGDAALLVSGRLPADMVLKGLAAGIQLLASVSAATADGAAAAERGGLTLVGFLRGERMNLYAHPEKITT